MLPRVNCPKCGMTNLKAEQICFACGHPLRRTRWKPQERPLAASRPLLLWVALLFVLGLAAFIAYAALVGLRGHLSLLSPPQQESLRLRLALGGAVLLLVGQVGFWLSRKKERSWWHLRRAPRLPMNQANVGDTVWLGGDIRCDSPLFGPASGQPCVYYRYVFQERGSKGGWRTVRRDRQAVDFSLEREGESVYVPCGDIMFDAALSTESGGGAFDDHKMEEHALFVGMPAFVCGNLAGTPRNRRIDAIAEGIPALVTYQHPRAFLQELSRQAFWLRAGAWASSVLGFLALALGLMRG